MPKYSITTTTTGQPNDVPIYVKADTKNVSGEWLVFEKKDKEGQPRFEFMIKREFVYAVAVVGELDELDS